MVRLRGALRALLVAAGLMYVCGVITESPTLGAQACAVWAAALLAYAMLADVPPQVRWLLRLGVGVFTVPMLAAALTALEPSQYGWFATGEYREPSVVEQLVRYVRWEDGVSLLAVVCLAAAVVRLPRQRRPWAAPVAGLLMLTAPILLTADLAALADEPPSAPAVIGAVWLPLAVAAVALAAAVLATQRAQTRHLATAGLALLSAPFLLAAHTAAAGTISWAYGESPVIPPLHAGMLPAGFSAALAWAGSLAAALVTGPVLVLLGCRGLASEPASPPTAASPQ